MRDAEAAHLNGVHGGSGRILGPWGFKALKQQVKVLFAMGPAEAQRLEVRYGDLLAYGRCDGSGPADISPQVFEKGLTSMLNLIMSPVAESSTGGSFSSPAPPRRTAAAAWADIIHGGSVLERMLEHTVDALRDAERHKRLWFKANMKLATLLLRRTQATFVSSALLAKAERSPLRRLLPTPPTARTAPATPPRTAKAATAGSVEDHAVSMRLQRLLRQLAAACGGGADAEEAAPPRDEGASQMAEASAGSGPAHLGTQLLEIYAMQILLYSVQRDHYRLRQVYQRALNVSNAVPHPRIVGVILECGGKMQMEAGEWKKAFTAFFQSFKSFDEAGDPRRISALKYLVLCAMLGESDINPFESQEAKAYEKHHEIRALHRMLKAFHAEDVVAFQVALEEQEAALLADPFMAGHVGKLLSTMRTTAMLRVLSAYSRISLQRLGKTLNDTPEDEVEALLVEAILMGRVNGRIDQEKGVFLSEPGKLLKSAAKVSGAFSQEHTVSRPQAVPRMPRMQLEHLWSTSVQENGLDELRRALHHANAKLFG